MPHQFSLNPMNIRFLLILFENFYFYTTKSPLMTAEADQASNKFQKNASLCGKHLLSSQGSTSTFYILTPFYRISNLFFLFISPFKLSHYILLIKQNHHPEAKGLGDEPTNPNNHSSDVTVRSGIISNKSYSQSHSIPFLRPCLMVKSRF